MVIDTSALLAILYDEPDARRYADAIAAAEQRLISAATLLETAVVVGNQAGPAAGRQLDVLVERTRITVVAVGEEHIRIARQAYLDFGKGNHPAGLNFGDCFAYALSQTSGEPLLYEGDDCARSDVASAL